MGRDDLVDDGQAQAGAFTAALSGNARKPLEDARTLVRGDADAGIRDAQDDPIAACVSRNGKRDAASRIGVSQGVVEQVVQSMAQPLRVDQNVRQAGREFQRDRDSFVLGTGTNRLGGGAEQSFGQRG